MANLLPENRKKEIQRKYFYRKFTVAMAMIFILILVGCVLMLAIYLYLIFGEVSKTEKGKTLSELSVADQSLVKEAGEINKKLDLLSPEKDERYPSQIFNEVITIRQGGIFLHHLAIECSNPGAGCVVAILGRAENRQALLEYTQALKESPLFVKVQSPINNLINSKDSQFTLELETSLVEVAKANKN